MSDRQVSVKIRAAFDAAFNATFATADERIKGMNASLRVLKGTASDIDGLKKSRESVSQLTSSLEAQTSAMKEVNNARKEAAAAHKALQKEEDKAREASRKAFAEYRQRLEAYQSEKALLKELEQPTREQIENLRRLKKAAQDAKDAHRASKEELDRVTRAAREHRSAALEAGTSIEALTRKEKELASGLKATEAQLNKAEDSAERYAASLKKAGIDTANLVESGHGLSRNIEHQTHALSNAQRVRRFEDRAEDLRADARTSLYTAVGTGYLAYSPLRDAIAFEKAMIRVRAMAGASSEEYRRLTEDARRLGAETVYSSLQVAGAQTELATAGFKTHQIMATMPYMLDLANSSLTGLARTAEITASVMQGFNMDVTDMKRVGDAMTAAYTSSASSLESLGEMMKYVAPVATVAGASLEEVLGASSVLHNNGIIGSMAGTTLRAIFLRLSDPPRETEKMLNRMKISIKDAAGNMRSYIDIIHDMNKALVGEGTATQAEAWKKLAGEEHAPGAARIAAAEKSGALQLEIKKYRLAPAFNELGSNLMKMSEADLGRIGQAFGVSFNRALSGGGMVMSLTGALNGLEGREFDSKLKGIFERVGFAPSLRDIRPEEYEAAGKKAEAALKKLHINPLKAMGGTKSNEEMTREIKAALQSLPMNEQLEHIEILFSKTRKNMRELFREFAVSGRNADQLLQALSETLNMERTRKELSGSTAHDLEQISGDWGDIKISLGESVIPLLKEFTTWFKPVSEDLAKWIKEHQGFARTIMLGVAGLFAFSAAMAAAKFALSGFMSIASGFSAVLGKGTVGRKASGMLWDGLKKGGSGVKKAGRLGLRLGWKGLTKGAGLARGAIELLISKGPLLISSFGMIINTVRALGAVLLANPIGLAIAGIAIAGFAIYKNWGAIRPWLVKTWESIQTYFVSLWSRVAKTIKIAWDWMKDYMSWHPVVYIAKNWEKLVDMFKVVYEKVRPYIKALFPAADSEIKVSGPDESGFLSRMIGGSGTETSLPPGLFDSPMKPVNIDVPELPSAGRVGGGSFSQRNVITVNANISVDAGPSAPAQVARKIKSEIQSAFKSVPSFDLFDPAVVS